MQKYPQVLLVTSRQSNFNWGAICLGVLELQLSNLVRGCNCSFTKNTTPRRHFSPFFNENEPKILLLMSVLSSTSQTIQLHPGRRREEGGLPVLRQGEQGQHHHQTLPGPQPGGGVPGVTGPGQASEPELDTATATIITDHRWRWKFGFDHFSFQSFIFNLKRQT